MSSLQVFELFLLLAALAGQFYFFFIALHRIRRYRHIFPDASYFFIRKVNIPVHEFRIANTLEILKKYLEKETGSSHEDHVKLALIDTEQAKNYILDQILLSINGYLLRSRGAVIDFVLVQNIVERKSAAYRQGIIRHSLFPVYIGLLAFILGVGIGIFFLPELPDELISSAVFRISAATLLSQAKWAVISALCGMVLTFLLLAFLYPSARNHFSKQKNEFYNFVQVELLPVLIQDTTHSLHLLQVSLNTFQRNFTDSIASLGDLMNKNYEALLAQEKTIAAIKEIDVMRLAQANLEMFQALDKSAGELQKFTQYLTSMDRFIENTASLNEKINEWLRRTGEIERVVGQIEESMRNNERLQAFIQSHFSELERRGQLINNTVIKVDNVLDKSLNELMEHTQHKIRAIRELTVREEDQLMKAFEDNKHIFGKLAMIEDLNRNFAAYKEQDATRQQKILEELQHLNRNLSRGKGGDPDSLLKKIFGK